MDRRQRKTRIAVFNALSFLLQEKNFSQISVQDIIDRANIGRSTFYAHFETKETLLKELADDLFIHILNNAHTISDCQNLFEDCRLCDSYLRHLLYHLKTNDRQILDLLSSQNNQLFLEHFKVRLQNLMAEEFMPDAPLCTLLPQELLIRLLSAAFVEMLQWWIEEGLNETPEQMDLYFQAIIEPLFSQGIEQN